VSKTRTSDKIIVLENEIRTTQKRSIKSLSPKEPKGKKTNTLNSKEDNTIESKMVKIINDIIKSNDDPPKRSIFKFENNDKAADHNSKILKACNYDYEKALRKQKDSFIFYGSEFRNTSKLEHLLKYHKNWDRLRLFLTNGTDTSFEPLDDEALKKDCIANMERGNHKSSSRTKKDEEFINKTYTKEVENGWMIPFNKDIVSKIKNACVIPIGTVLQMTIDENGHQIEKRRLTHDCSWEGPSGFSVNNRIKEELLEPLQYGRCILRVLHQIQLMRFKNPSQKILMSKIDLDSAYRRLHWHAKCALLCLTIINNIVYLLTRLCFGIASGPSEWCLISEMIVDIASVLINDPTWDPKKTFNPKEEISFEIEYANNNTQIKKCKNIMVKLQDKDNHIDGYIDDLLTIILNSPRLIPRGIQVIPLVCFIFFRPVHTNEPIKRTDIISDKKLKAEGNLSEIKTF